TARDWEEHSQEVLNTLQLTSQRLDRIDLTSRLYLLGKNEDDLRIVQSTVVTLDAGLSHLASIVQENASQSAHARAATACVQKLKQLAEYKLPQSAELAVTDMGRQIRQCREVITRMQAEENALLKQRTSESQRSSYRSFSAGAIFLILSLAIVIILFGVLLRDARRRHEIEEEISKTNTRLGETVATLENKAVEARMQVSAREELQLCMNVAQAHTATVRYCAELLPLSNIALLIINNSRQLVELAASAGDNGQIRDGFPLEACCGLRGGQTRWRKPGYSEIDCTHFQSTPPENYLCMPLTAHGDTLGILYVACPTVQAAAQLEARMETLRSTAKMAAVFIGSLNLRARLEHQSIRDGVTNLFNRHFMEISLEREIRRASRSNAELTVLMLDVDHFKQFNDTFGHEAGDYVLRKVAEVFSNAVRAEDMVCRYGGEEFVMILPETGIDSAIERAEEIRRRVQELRLRFRGEALREITISIGVAVFPLAGSALEDLLRNADRALYAAKNQGRNRIVVSDAGVPV
ncbi:MAG TPA: diguanylate cyclase, partial [Pseudacidobacterium sp.]|nr:diguanylate cyclase [Pseudacidobacterium sp.]